MIQNAPRTLVVLLVTNLVIKLPFLAIAGGIFKIQFLLLALITWFALQGKEAAAALFAGLTVLGAIAETILLVSVFAGRRHLASLIPYLSVDIFQVLVAVYILRSKAVASYFARSRNDNTTATPGP